MVAYRPHLLVFLALPLALALVPPPQPEQAAGGQRGGQIGPHGFECGAVGGGPPGGGVDPCVSLHVEGNRANALRPA